MWSSSAVPPSAPFFHASPAFAPSQHQNGHQSHKRQFYTEEEQWQHQQGMPQPPQWQQHDQHMKRMRHQGEADFQSASFPHSFNSHNMPNPSPTSILQPAYHEMVDQMEVEDCQGQAVSSGQPMMEMVGRNTNAAKYGHMLNQAWFLNHMTKPTTNSSQNAVPHRCWKCYAATNAPSMTIMCQNCSRYCCNTSSCIILCDDCNQLHCTACIMVDYRHHIQERKLCIDCYYRQ